MVMEAVYPPLQPEDCSRINDGAATATLEAATATMEGIRNWFTGRGLLGGARSGERRQAQVYESSGFASSAKGRFPCQITAEATFFRLHGIDGPFGVDGGSV